MMKNKAITALLLALLMLVSAGCTRNNGDIGDLYGRWKVETLTADGVGLPLYDGEVEMYALWFQSELVWIHELFPHQDYLNHKGMWKREGDKLLLDFSFTGDYDEQYRPPVALHFVENGVTPLTVASESSSKMTLWYVGDDGVRYEYHLRKVY